MDPVSAALITGGSSLLSGFMSSTTSASNVQAQIAAQQQMQGQSEQFNAQQAQIARDYTTQMSNSAYQRASADMQKAGLNPAMMFGSGGAASTPGSPSPAIGTPTPPVGAKSNPLAGLSDAASKAVSSAIEAQTYNKMVEEIANTKTQGRVLEAERDLLGARRGETQQNIAIRTPQEVEAQGVMNMGDSFVKGAGKVRYVGQGISDMLTPLLSGAGSVSRLASDKLMRDINRGNFIGRYGTPVGEYLAQ